MIIGIPVCTVEVSGMKEMLGENNEEALYQGIKRSFVEPGLLEHNTKQEKQRGKDFSTGKTVQAVEKLLIELCEE